MTTIKCTLLLIAVVSLALAGSAPRAQDAYCASQPPPAGLVERCRSRLIAVPDDVAAFRLTLTEWLDSCVASGRAAGLVRQATSVEDVWRRMQDRPAGVRAVRITPRYEPLKFEENGRTCYGVKSVEFSLPSGSVSDDGPSEVTRIPAQVMITDEMIKESATAAREALAQLPLTPELRRFEGVLAGLEQYGSSFDDRYYPVAPLEDDGSWNPYACFKDYNVRSGRYDCLPATQAMKACQRNLAVEIVTSHMFDRVSSKRFAEILDYKANDIQRGVNYLLLAQHSESGAIYCPGLRDAIKPTVGQLARKGKTTVYGYY